MTDVFTLGQGVTIDGLFTNAAGAPVNPTNLTLVVVKPDGTDVPIDPLTFTHPATGEYHADYLPDQPGTHRYLWSGTAPQPAASDGEFYVREPLTEPREGWQPPSAATVWEESRLDFEEQGFAGAAQLEPLVQEAAAWVGQVTGRQILAADTEGTVLTAIEYPLARSAVRMRTEQLTQRSSSDAITVAGQEGIQSASVAGLSISFRDPGGGTQSKSGIGAVPTGWAALNEILFALMTPERREYWLALAQGIQPPAFAVQEVDWTAGSWGWGTYGEGF